ncbi:MAG: hypothetical protein BJ554DRAFT_2937 [Olpidium bornovanus]|uniref:Uncharacterized protein n=1 Tax=Olpidium bornovanus TaxID=278681 RepID=A0A8H7ZQ92_9FUNG|nr:MAG: hypothetical protein BJ554DRAFT_2937 [Olpidium bornovanus]
MRRKGGKGARVCLVARELQDPAVALLEETSLLRADIASKQAVLDRYRDLAAAWELEFGQLERDGVRVLCANQQRRAVPDGGAAGKGDDDRDRRPCDGAEFMEVEA